MNDYIDDNSFVKISEIYDDVLYCYGYIKNDKMEYNSKNKTDYESKKRNLRNKYRFLMKNIIYRDSSQFRKKSTDMVPKNDAPIIRDLLFYSISDEPEDEIIVRWFNNKINLSDPENSFLLYNYIKPIITNSLIEGETDDVTCEEWDRAIRSSINYNTAVNTKMLMNKITEFRDCTLPLNQDIDYGSVICNVTIDDSGETLREKVLSGKTFDFDLRKETIVEALKKVSSQNDYLEIIKQVIQLLNDHAQKAAIEKIKGMAVLKEAFDVKKADDSIEPCSLASEYIIWFQNIYKYLKNYPDVCKEVEEYAKTSNILDFFKMDNR